ncbi:hypothetical protein WN943_010434 [Citrus x changshan-huyou]
MEDWDQETLEKPNPKIEDEITLISLTFLSSLTPPTLTKISSLESRIHRRRHRSAAEEVWVRCMWEREGKRKGREGYGLRETRATGAFRSREAWPVARKTHTRGLTCRTQNAHARPHLSHAKRAHLACDKRGLARAGCAYRTRLACDRPIRAHLAELPPFPENKNSTLSAHNKTSSVVSEIDAENQISDLEMECKNRRRKDGTRTLKDEQSLGQKLNFRRVKVVELHPVDRTPTRLKFKKRVLGDK